MALQFCPVEHDSAGVFFSVTPEGRKLFGFGDGSTLSCKNSPGGSWPICYAFDEREQYLYFTCFCI